MPPPPYPIIATSSHRRPRYGLLVLAALALAAAGIGAALVLRPPGALPALLKAESVTGPVTAPDEKRAAQPPQPAVRSTETTPMLARTASVCLACGTVEAVIANAATTGSKAGSAYQVQVRMDDGTLRHFSSATPPQPGAAVRVQGDSFRVARAGG